MSESEEEWGEEEVEYSIALRNEEGKRIAGKVRKVTLFTPRTTTPEGPRYKCPLDTCKKPDDVWTLLRLREHIGRCHPPIIMSSSGAPGGSSSGRSPATPALKKAKLEPMSEDERANALELRVAVLEQRMDAIAGAARGVEREVTPVVGPKEIGDHLRTSGALNPLVSPSVVTDLLTKFFDSKK